MYGNRVMQINMLNSRLLSKVCRGRCICSLLMVGFWAFGACGYAELSSSSKNEPRLETCGFTSSSVEISFPRPASVRWVEFAPIAVRCLGSLEEGYETNIQPSSADPVIRLDAASADTATTISISVMDLNSAKNLKLPRFWKSKRSVTRALPPHKFYRVRWDRGGLQPIFYLSSSGIWSGHALTQKLLSISKKSNAYQFRLD